MLRIMISALFLCISCTPANVTTAIKAIEIASDLVTILDYFDRSLNEFQGSINQATFYLDSDNNISSDQKAIAWEEKWQEAGIKLESIHQHYRKVEEQIEQYFLSLDHETDVIQSEELRKSEHKKNKKLLGNWNTVKQKFVTQIQLADAIEKEGRDIRQILILAAMRNKLDEKVSHVLDLHKRLTKVNDELSDLTIQTRKLLGLKPSKVVKVTNAYQKTPQLNQAQDLPAKKVTVIGTEDDKAFYSLGVMLGENVSVFNLSTNELSFVILGLQGKQDQEESKSSSAVANLSIISAKRAKKETTLNLTQSEINGAFYHLGGMLKKNISAFYFSENELSQVIRGLRDKVRGQEDPDTAKFRERLRAISQKRIKAQGKKIESLGKAFLLTEAKKPGAKLTRSGLVITHLKEGTGTSPKASDQVKVHYRGTFIDGTEFDSSFKRNKPAEITLNRVILCWTEGVQLMKVDGKARLVCPSELAYGERGTPGIGPYSTLIFEIELLGIMQ